MKLAKKLTAICLSAIMVLSVFTIVPFTVSAAGNTTQTATSYSFGSRVSGSITDSNTKDFYKFTLTSSGRISISVIARIYCSNYFIYDSNGAEVWNSVNCYWNNSSETMNLDKYIDLTSGTYYFSVQKNYTYKGSYNFTINYKSASESFKETGKGSNNSILSANSIVFNSNYNGQIAQNDDKDFYKFTLSSSGRITINLAAKIYCTNYYIYDSSGTEIWNSTYCYWNNSSETFNLDKYIDLTSGTYYFSVQKNYTYTGNYNFIINYKSASESFKESGKGNNNSISNANTITLNSSYNGQIAQNDDKDFYKFTISSSGKAVLTVNANIYCSNYYIYNVNGNEIWNSTYRYWNNDNEKMTLNQEFNLTSGTYYFSVQKNYSYTGNYNFKISQIVTPTSVTVSPTSVTLGKGESYSLSKTIYPSNAEQGCTWSSSNTYVATVSSSGKVTAYNNGTAYITVRTNNGKTAQCKVVVKSAPTSVKTNPTSVTLGVGEKYTVSEETNSGSYANASNLKWSSSSSSIASVTKGSGNKATVTAKSVGTTYVKISLYNGKTAQCKVVVKPAPTSVKTNPASVTLGVGEKYTISESTNSGSYANATNLKWSSSNSTIASVAKGSANKATITAKSVGTTYVKITLYNGKTAECKVVVKPAPTSVKTNPTSITIKKGATYTISETTNSGSYANASNLKWTSSNTSVATVAKGSGNKAVVTGKKAGTAYIKITLYNGKTAQCKVTVK